MTQTNTNQYLYTMNQQASLHNMQSTLEHSVLKYIQTDNPIVNSMITFMIISMITTLIPKMAELPNFFLKKFYNIFDKIKYLLFKIFKKKSKHCKSTFIEKITYKLSASQIQIDGDTNSKRNDKIECWFETDKIDDTFLDHFVKVCMDKYMIYCKNKNTKRHIWQNIGETWTSITEQLDSINDTIVLKNDDKKEIMNRILY
jgi:hypothetical protein